MHVVNPSPRGAHSHGAACHQVLELCKALLETVDAQDRQLSAHEAACLLPCIVEKAGHNAVRCLAGHAFTLMTSGGQQDLPQPNTTRADSSA